MEYRNLIIIALLLALCATVKGQDNPFLPDYATRPETKEVKTANGPSNITRSIQQDRKGHIWMAAFDGVFRYDGRSFTNMSSEVSSARFFSVLEDRTGNMWFGSIGSGVFGFNGKFFQQFTSQEGLINEEIFCIYEDKRGNIWFGANGGISRYDGKSFRNYILKGGSMVEDTSGQSLPNFQRPPNEVNVIIEDRTGKIWFGTRSKTFVYDGSSFTAVTHGGKPFTNVRWLIEDRKGHIWLGGHNGLWRYDGSTFTQLTKDFTGFIYEDKTGNIWTSSATGPGDNWALSRYDASSLSAEVPIASEVTSEKRMLFGISEGQDGSIWFGSLNGVHRYDGTTITDFKNKEEPE